LKYYFFSVYAPTETESNIELKEIFYDSLNDCLFNFPKNSNIILFGDFNARIGSYKPHQDNVRGIYLNDSINVNGQHLLNLCAVNDLVIANSYFDKREYSSWYHPKTKVGYTIDYCILSANLKSALYDSGVNYANEFSDIDSDHYPVFIDLCINSCHKDSKKFKYLKKKEDVQNRNINLDYSVLKNEFEIANNLNQDILYNLSNYENVTMTEFLQLVGVSCAKFLPNKDMKSKSNRNWLNNKEVNDLFYYRRLAQHLWWNDQDNQYLYNNYNVIKYACRKKLRKFKCDFYKDKSRRMMEAFNSNNMSLFYEC